jgi:hypothetical protein
MPSARHLWLFAPLLATGCSLLFSFDGFGGSDDPDGSPGGRLDAAPLQEHSQDEGSADTVPDDAAVDPVDRGDVGSPRMDDAADEPAAGDAASDGNDSAHDAEGEGSARGDGAPGPVDADIDAPRDGTPCYTQEICGHLVVSKVYRQGVCVDDYPNWKNKVPSCGTVRVWCNPAVTCNFVSSVCYPSWDCSMCCQ